MQIQVEKAPGQKCKRCSRFTMDVGVNKYWPNDLCLRCCENLAGDGWLPDLEKKLWKHQFIGGVQVIPAILGPI